MKKKNGINMYINYSKSYRRRSRRGVGGLLKLLLIVLLALGLGLGAYFVSHSLVTTEREAEDGKELTEGDNTGTLPDSSQQGIASGEKTGSDQAGIPLENQQEGASAEQELQGSGDGSGTVTDSQLPKDNTSNQTVNTDNTKEDYREPVKVKGIYLTSKAAREGSRDKLIEIADTTEINAMVIDVKDDTGKITYSMDSKIAQEIGAITNEIPDINNLIKILKEKEIYVIARIVAFKDPYLAEQRHDLALKKENGSLYRDNNGECWVNPYNHEVWDYLVEVASQAAATGFDEVQFDYIRFSTGKGMDQVDFGEEAVTKTKEEIIIEFTKYAYEKLKPLGVFVSADVYGTIISSSTDAGLVGQNYVEMSKYLDYICPMIYPSHFGEGNYGVDYPDLEPFKIVRKVLTASKEKLGQIPQGEHRAVVRPWLQDFTASWLDNYMEYGGKELREQIGGVYGAGYEEWLLWDAGCNYSVDGLVEE